MSRSYIAIAGIDADDLQVTTQAGDIIVSLDAEHKLRFDSARDFARWFDQLLELALLAPEIVNAWDTYPVIAP